MGGGGGFKSTLKRHKIKEQMNTNSLAHPKFNSLLAKKWWLEDDPFLPIGWNGNFSGVIYVKLREGKLPEIHDGWKDGSLASSQTIIANGPTK